MAVGIRYRRIKRVLGKEATLPFYSDKTTVSTFEYRGSKAAILTAQRGATHCGLEHEADKTVCDNCDATIDPTEVILIEINGADIGVDFAVLELKDAEEFAKAYIDGIEDGPKNMDTMSQNQDRSNRRRKKKDPYSALLPGSGASNLIDIIKKLGWEGEGRRILNKYGKVSK